MTINSAILIDDKQSSTCKELKITIIDRYVQLRSGGTLAINRPGNYINDIIEKYIPPGMGFGKAEQLLTDCGFKVDKRPGTDATGDYPDRYNVYATLDSFVKANFWMQPTIVINLTPNSPQNYETVKSTYTRIQVVAP